MNIISTCLQIDAAGARITDSYGTETEVTLPLGAAVRLDFDLRGAPDPGTGVLVPYDAEAVGSGAAACYFVLDRDFDSRTEPLLLRTGGVTISPGSNGSGAIFSVPIPNTGVAPLVSALAGRSSAAFFAEIGALNQEGVSLFAYQFAVTVRNRLFMGGDAPESVSSDPAYCTTAEVRALLAGDVSSTVAAIVNSHGYVTSGGVSALVSGSGYVTSGAVAALVDSALGGVESNLSEI